MKKLLSVALAVAVMCVGGRVTAHADAVSNEGEAMGWGIAFATFSVVGGVEAISNYAASVDADPDSGAGKHLTSVGAVWLVASCLSLSASFWCFNKAAEFRRAGHALINLEDGQIALGVPILTGDARNGSMTARLFSSAF